MNKNFHKIILLIIIICVFLVVLAFVSSNDSDDVITEQVGIESELERLKKANLDNFENLDLSQESRLNPISDNDKIIGELKDGSVEVIIYSSFDCPFCTDLNDIINFAKKDFTEDDVVFAYRHFVMRSQSSAMDSAVASECANDQGQYWEMHEKLFDANRDENLNAITINKSAEELDLDMVEFNQCFMQKKHKDDILLEMLSAKNAGVNGTPTVFVNKEIYPGSIPYDDYVDDQGEEREGLNNIIKRHLENK